MTVCAQYVMLLSVHNNVLGMCLLYQNSENVQCNVHYCFNHKQISP